jgi:hypothetical protein
VAPNRGRQVTFQTGLGWNRLASCWNRSSENQLLRNDGGGGERSRWATSAEAERLRPLVCEDHDPGTPTNMPVCFTRVGPGLHRSSACLPIALTLWMLPAQFTMPNIANV